MDLFFADARDLPAALPWKSARAEVFAVCPDDLSHWLCGRRGLPGEIINAESTIVPRESWDEVVGLSTRLAASWYNDPDGRDFTSYQGISLGWLLAGLSWSETFGGTYRFAESVLRLFQEHSPKTVWAAGGLAPYKKALVESACRRFKTPLRWQWLERRPPPDHSLTKDFCNWPLRNGTWLRSLLNMAPRSPFRSSPEGKKRILASYYFTIHRLIGALGMEQDIEPVFYDWPGRRLPKLPAWRKWRFLTAPRRAGLSEDGRKALAGMSRRFEDLSRSRRYQQAFSFRGLDCWEAARLRLSRIVAEDLPLLADAVEAVGEALDREPPDLVLVPYDSSPSERLLLEAARRRGIPSALMAHGIASVPRNPIEDVCADRLLVWGPAMADCYADIGFPRERIIVTGHPLLDSYPGLTRRPGPRGGPVRILFASSYLPIERNVGKVLDILRRFSGVSVTFKLHPGEPLVPYQRILAGRLDDGCRLEWRRPMEELLLEADLVLSGPSTAVIEAATLGIPIMLLNLERMKLGPPYYGGWGLDPIESLEELEERLRGLLPDRVPASADYSGLLEAFAGRPDGLSTRRAVDALKGLLKVRPATGTSATAPG
ncbi:MAG: hypothetical protein HY748_08790 [Elusimicrobia bacterium]|nr:hypothetical protein [Elusimicrobiota bacterium]